MVSVATALVADATCDHLNQVVGFSIISMTFRFNIEEFFYKKFGATIVKYRILWLMKLSGWWDPL